MVESSSVATSQPCQLGLPLATASPPVTPPLVEVVEHRRENRSVRFDLGWGNHGWLCGVAVSVDRLACGHIVEAAGGGKAKRRRCPECAGAE
jgi:hypothetical protein